MADTPYPTPPSESLADLDPETATTDQMVVMAHAHRAGEVYPTGEQLLSNLPVVLRGPVRSPAVGRGHRPGRRLPDRLDHRRRRNRPGPARPSRPPALTAVPLDGGAGLFYRSRTLVLIRSLPYPIPRTPPLAGLHHVLGGVAGGAGAVGDDSGVRQHHGRHQVRPVVAVEFTAVPTGHPPQPGGQARDQQWAQGGGVGDGGIEPARFSGRVQDHRHPVVDRRDPGVGLGDQDRAGFEDLAVPPPVLPQPGEGDRLAIGRGDTVRLLTGAEFTHS